MQIPSFHESLANRPEEILGITSLALVIPRARAAGVSRDDLRRLTQLSTDLVKGLRTAMVAAGQVTVVQAGGQRAYRAAN